MKRHWRRVIPLQVAAAVATGLLGLAVGGAPPAHAQALDVNAVFWCNAGKKTGEQTEGECVAARDAILNNCTACHAITPIVKAQKDPPGWAALLKAHRSRVPNVTDADYLGMQKFLQEHYNPQHPPPKLPPELEALGVPPA